MSTQALLQTGAALHRQGAKAEAEKAYRLVLSFDPNNADAHALLGTLLSEQKKHDEALASISKAISLDPQAALFHFHLGNAYDKAKQPLHAEQAFKEALRLKPDWDEAWYNLGNAQRASNRNDDALLSYEKTLALNPKHLLAYNNSALLYSKKQDYKSARAQLDKGLALDPRNVQLLLSLNEIAFEHNDMPAVFEAASRVTKIKLGIEGDNVIEFLKDPSRINTQDTEMRSTIFALGTSYLLQGHLKEASYVLRTLLSLEPNLGEVLQSLGSVALARNKLALADAQYGQAFMLDPTDTAALWNRSMALLAEGNLSEGWKRYRWRWKALDKFKAMALHAPYWDGYDAKGKTILVHEEQGFGDSLQMLRFLPALKAKGARVYFYARPVLQPLIENWPGADKVISWDVTDKSVPADIDYVCGAMDLPGHLGFGLNNLPAQPYLPNPRKGDPKYTLQSDKKKIGIVWAGNPLHKRDHERSTPFALWADILKIKGAAFYSLQFKPSAEDQQRMKEWNITDLAPQIKNLADTAAFLDQLDLLISVDSAPVHLAGALGRKVWTLITHSPDWRWLLNRDDSPWYPSLRLFRQPSRGDWAGAMSNVKKALEADIH
jgi:tetratricopeptide (TPR) repeat protein